MENNKKMLIGLIVIILILIGVVYYFKFSPKAAEVATNTAATSCPQPAGADRDACLKQLAQQTGDSTLCPEFSTPELQQECQKFTSSTSEKSTTPPPPPPVSGGGTTAPPVPVTPPVSGQAIVEKDIKYGPDVKQDLDVYSNTGFKNAPIAILVHGGSWTMGSKGDMTAVATKAFYPEGFVSIPVDYRLMNTNTLLNDYPTGINDVACAVAWAKANASKYGGDPNKIVLYGQSAGSHLTGMVAYDPEGPWLTGCQTQGQSLKVAGYMGSGGVYDFTLVRADQRWQPGCLLEQFLGLTSCGPGNSSWGKADPTKLKDASPIGHVNAGDPQALLVNGDADCYVNYPDANGKCQANSVAMAAALKAVGVPYTLYTIPGYAHGDFHTAFGVNPSNFPEALNFLAKFK